MENKPYDTVISNFHLFLKMLSFIKNNNIVILNEAEIYRFIWVTKKVRKVTYQFLYLYLNSNRTARKST